MFGLEITAGARVPLLEGDLITALERQDFTRIGGCRDLQARTFDNLPGAMHYRIRRSR